jgi:hypothetical protein
MHALILFIFTCMHACMHDAIWVVWRSNSAVQTRFGWTIHPGEFPNSVLNGNPLDLFNLYRAVVDRGGFKMGNAINWKGEVCSRC